MMQLLEKLSGTRSVNDLDRFDRVTFSGFCRSHARFLALRSPLN